jgi:DNA-binding MarR family transcriptional regulator
MSEPTAGWLSEEQQRVWRSFLLANVHINEYLEAALRAFDLSLAEYELLVRLSESPGHTIRMGELAASVGHSRSRPTAAASRPP